MKTYRINEVFYSLQGEGVRAGTANLFLRFTGCNETCAVETHGFDCDTEFTSGRTLTIDQILSELAEAAARREPPPMEPEAPARGSSDDTSHQVRTPRADNPTHDSSLNAQHSALSTQHSPLWIIFTGGEPALQVDRELIDALHGVGYKLAIETNGSIALPDGIDWITVSPKVAEHAIRQRIAHEVKYVRAYGQAIPRTVVQAGHKLISPAFFGDQVDRKTLEWCIQLVKENPDWRLSIQMHKAWRIR